jgi:hypothetical protein
MRMSSPSFFEFGCRNQSCVWNWIQAAASRFSDSAGMNWRRVSSDSATSRGFGESSAGSGSG